jgi:hypothetical protein
MDLSLRRLPDAIPSDDVAVMRQRFWTFLAERDGVRPDEPWSWTVETPRHLQALRRSGAFAAMAAPAVVAALDDLLGDWRRPRNWGLPLVTFPGSGWRVPTTGWHLDSYSPEHDLPGVSVFAFLLPTGPRGGGTVVLEGSHQLVNRHIAATGVWRSGPLRADLAAAHPWLAEVWQGRHEPGASAVLDGVPVTVRELTGDPGDVVLMHPRTLHAAAPNAAATPRMMLVEIINRSTVDGGRSAEVWQRRRTPG